jgi:hypothetical protein
VNVHGSFPLGIAYLLVAGIGCRLDGASPSRELRALRWAGAGMLLGAVGPLGSRVLLFPVELLRRQDVLQNVIEWRAPAFDSFSQRMFIAQLALAIVLLARRPSYRSALLIAVFGGVALLGARNLTVASLVLVPVMAAAAPDIGSLRSRARPAITIPLCVVGAAAIALLGTARLGQRDYELRGYPVDALAFVDQANIDLTEHHLATQDVVGNLQELVLGATGQVFYDDRFDMFPDDVTEAHLALVQSSPRVRAELEAFDIELVIWDRAGAVAQRLIADADWRVLYSDEHAIVACRRGARLDGVIGTC